MAFTSAKKTRQTLGVSETTLRRMADNGDIQCIRKDIKGSHRYYNVDEYINRRKNITFSNEPKSSLPRSICYCRVSTRNQQDDLARQIKYMQSLYPKHEIIKDIGSGINFSRKGLKTILDEAIRGNIKEIVVAHKDRLCRFGFELVNHIITKYSKANIVVLNNTTCSPEAELANDVLQILTVFSARINGLRKYTRKIKKDTTISNS